MSPLAPSISSVADKSKLKKNESISETRLAALESQVLIATCKNKTVDLSISCFGAAERYHDSA
jgi:hypothetical protein